MPYVESHYRVRTDRANRAIAGLSMGGRPDADVGAAHLEEFAYLGVFSSGRVRDHRPAARAAAPPGPSFEEQHRAALDDAKRRRG